MCMNMCKLWMHIGCTCTCNWPDVSGAGGGELARVLGGEGDAVDVLREGLAPQHYLLSLPLPDGEHKVGVSPHRSQELAVAWAEVHVAVHLLGAATQHALQL